MKKTFSLTAVSVLLASTILVSVLFTAIITHRVWASPDDTMPIYLHSFIKDAKVIIENDDGTYKAWDGTTGDLKSASTNPVTAWNWTRDNGLTDGRTSKERVVFKGEFEIDYNVDNIAVPNYTCLDFTAGSTLKVKDGVEWIDDVGIIVNKDNPATDIEIRGLTFDENAVGSPDGWAYLLYFSNTSNFLLKDSDCSSPNISYGVEFIEQGENVKIDNCVLEANSLNIYQNKSYVTRNILKTGVSLHGDDAHVSQNVFSEANSLNIYGDNGKITFNEFHDVDIHVYGDNNKVGDNTLIDGVIHYSGGGGSIGRNTIEHNRYFAWGIGASGDNMTITSNVLEGEPYPNTQSIGIETDGQNVAVTANIISLFGKGIGVEWTGESETLTANIIHNCTNKGIYIRGADFIVLIGNIIRQCARGIHIDNYGGGGNNCTILGNTLVDCPIYVILDEGSGTIKEHNMGYP